MLFGPSNTAGRVNEAFLITVAASVVLLVAVTAVMIFFLIRYNRKRSPVPGEIRDNITLEIVWTALPTVLVLALFYFGWVDFDYLRRPPKDAMNVAVTARQWSWAFTYSNGKQADVLRVPVGKPVRLSLVSEDVIHGFFIPAFRIKEDTVPGLTTRLWFTANEPGSYDVFCSEYCGAGHSRMVTKLIAMTPEEFDAWLNEQVPSGAKGLDLLQAKGCLGCHSIDGSKKIGPGLKGLYGRQVVVVTGGVERTVTADDAYLKRSILEPQADIVKGYPPVMPPTPLTSAEVDEIVGYLRTLQ